MTTLKRTPRADGFYMPAEWAQQTQTWMIWPERPDNWRLGGKPVQRAHVALAKAIARFEPVTVGVSAAQYDNARAHLDMPNIRVVELSNNDAWVRDTGPTFVINSKGEVRGVDWDFNAWGGFDGGLYAPWNLDEQVATKIMEIERCPRYETEGFVLEGGSIHVDGEGTLITTEECLLNRNRTVYTTTRPTGMWITFVVSYSPVKCYLLGLMIPKIPTLRGVRRPWACWKILAMRKADRWSFIKCLFPVRCLQLKKSAQASIKCTAVKSATLWCVWPVLTSTSWSLMAA